jgi:hypothetical protein
LINAIAYVIHLNRRSMPPLTWKLNISCRAFNHGVALQLEQELVPGRLGRKSTRKRLRGEIAACGSRFSEWNAGQITGFGISGH